MGLTNARRWYRVEETSVMHSSFAENIDEKKTNEDEETGEVCFKLIYEYTLIVKRELLPFTFFFYTSYTYAYDWIHKCPARPW